MTRLHLFGDGPVAAALAELAPRLGYDEVHVRDAPDGPLGPDDHVVVCSAQAARGRGLLARILETGDPGYLGLVGTERAALVALLQLAADRIPKARIDRIAAPAGLPVGAQTPDEVAVAVAAELVARRRRPG